MARLLQIFGFLSVLFRGAILTFQSLAIGGIVFLIFVLRRANHTAELVGGPGLDDVGGDISAETRKAQPGVGKACADGNASRVS